MSRSLRADEIDTERHGRRAALTLIGAAGAVLVAAGTASAQDEPVPLCSDSDPYDPGGYGRHCGGCSDSDPYDPYGAGRHCGAPSRCSDYDPYDPGGAGRHCGTRSRCSDSDPYDRVGHGRSC